MIDSGRVQVEVTAFKRRRDPLLCLTPASSHLPAPPLHHRLSSSSSSSCKEQLSSSMVALWLQSVSLLVLLVVLRPGSQALAPPQHLCGSHLVEALYLVCGDKGFFHPPKRDVDPLLGFLPPKAGGAATAGGENEVADFAFKDQMEMMVKRGIVEECCHNPCNMIDLENYCN